MFVTSGSQLSVATGNSNCADASPAASEHSTALFNAPGAVDHVGANTSITVIVLDTEARGLPQGSVAVHVSITVPQPLTGVALNVEALEIPIIKHPPLKLLEYAKVLGGGIDPHGTVISPGAVIVGNAAGFTWITLDALIVLLQSSVKVQDSVMSPPQYPAGFCVLNVDVTEPLISQSPLSPLV
jgi:hypothetical protein